jgi:hypothetical protein
VLSHLLVSLLQSNTRAGGRWTRIVGHLPGSGYRDLDGCHGANGHQNNTKAR